MNYLAFKKNIYNEYAAYLGDYKDCNLSIFSLILTEFLASEQVRLFLENEIDTIKGLSCNLFSIYKLNSEDVRINDFFPDNENCSALILKKNEVINLINQWENFVKQNKEKIILYFEDGVYSFNAENDL